MKYIFIIILIIQSFKIFSDVKLLPPETGIYHTVFSVKYSTPDNISKQEVPYFVNLVNKKIVWMNFSNDWFNGIKFPEQSVKNIYNAGALPSIRIMPWSTYSKFDTKYPLRKIINGSYDKELIQWAKDLEKTGIPVLIDFAAEPNGNWFPWCGELNGKGKTDNYGDKSYPDGPELWRDAYRHVINLFKKSGATKVTWVFHVNAVGAADEEWNKIKYYYPGDDYIDWLGLSAYGPQRWGEKYIHFLDVMKPGYYDLAALSDTKPIAVLEFGVADYLPEISKPNWIQDALYSVQTSEFYRIKAVGWWNSTWWNTDGTISAIQIDSSPESLRFYKEAIAQPVFVGEYRLSN